LSSTMTILAALALSVMTLSTPRFVRRNPRNH
jgi:hypothetical protein